MSDIYILRAENARMRRALEECRSPMLYLQRYAAEEGRELDGRMAVTIAQSPSLIRYIVRDGLGESYL